jgi:hypothetical protein
MKRLSLVLTAMLTASMWPGGARADDTKIRILKLEILQIRHIEKKFAAGLKFCSNLDGKHVFLENQQRIVSIDAAEASLQNLIKDNVFNPAKKRPWNADDAAERIDQMRKLAEKERSDCASVAKLPSLQKELAELEAKPR